MENIVADLEKLKLKIFRARFTNINLYILEVPHS